MQDDEKIQGRELSEDEALAAGFPPGMQVIKLEPGRIVLCDLCNGDWTDRPESGGFYGLGSKAICPDCAPELFAELRRNPEPGNVRALCPPGKSFADWVREDLR